MNKKIKLFSLLAVSGTAILATAIISTNKVGNNFFLSANNECNHHGNHYLAHEATNETTGNEEYWICCNCNESFTTKPKVGTWTNFDNFDSSIGGLRDEHKLFFPRCLFAGESVKMENGYSYEVVSGDGATISDDKVLLKKPGEVSIKVSKGDFEKTFTKNIIDFGNVTGEATDLATVLDAWNYGDAGYGNVPDSNVTLARVDSITDAYSGGTATMNALDYARPKNDGTNRNRTNNLLFIRPEVVAKAVKAGYTHISFYAFVPRVDNSLDSTYLGLFNSTSAGGLDGSNNAIGTAANNGDTWRFQSIPLTALKENHGIGFAINSKHLYLTNVRFYGADIGSVAEKYFTTTKTDRSKDLIDQNLVGKMFTTVSNCESMVYHSSGVTYESDNGGGDYFEFTRKGFEQSGFNTPFNGIIINADWIKAAKKAGYNGLAVYFKLASAVDGQAANFFRMGVNTGKTLAVFNSAQNGFVNIQINNVAEGQPLVIGFKGSKVTLSGMTFRTTGTSGDWSSSYVLNSGDLNLANS